jgi:hypothetical protein
MISRAMSLAVVFKGPEGCVLAADSRVTLTSEQTLPGPPEKTMVLPTYFDNATKLLSLRNYDHLGIVTYGQGAIGLAQPRTAHGFIPEFEAHLDGCQPAEGSQLSVEEVARELGAFFNQQWTQSNMPTGGDPMVFVVAGYNDGEAYGRVFQVDVPSALTPVEQLAGEFGVNWGGSPYLLERLVNGTAPRAIEIAKEVLGLSQEQVDDLAKKWNEELALSIPYQFLPLQDAVDLASFLVDMTGTVMTWTVGIQGVGGEVDVATITRAEGFRAVEKKQIRPWA